MAAANAVLDIVERENIVAHVAKVGAYLQDRLHREFVDLPMVGEVRGVGMLGAVEFVADPKTKTRLSPEIHLAARISKRAREKGLIVRSMPHGEIIGFAPPLIITESQVDEMVGIAGQATREILAEVNTGAH